MNSLARLRDPILIFMSVKQIVQANNIRRAVSEQGFEKRKAARSALYDPISSGKTARSSNFGDTLGAVAGIAGAASYFNPILAPVAAVGGVGYGTYKLGQSFNWW